MLYLGDLPKFTNFMALWNFNMGVNGKILKCAISWKQLIIEQNGRKFGTQGTTVDLCRVLFMPESLSLVWGHLVHFVKFAMLRFSKGYCCHSFHSISGKLYCKYVGHEGIQAVTVLAICQNLKILWRFEIFVNTEPYGTGNFKTLLLRQFSCDLGQTLW